MVTISNISACDFAGYNVSVTFSNGAQLLAKAILDDEHEYILHVNGKLVQVLKKDLSCKVLAEGVSIR